MHLLDLMCFWFSGWSKQALVSRSRGSDLEPLLDPSLSARGAAPTRPTPMAAVVQRRPHIPPQKKSFPTTKEMEAGWRQSHTRARARERHEPPFPFRSSGRGEPLWRLASGRVASASSRQPSCAFRCKYVEAGVIKYRVRERERRRRRRRRSFLFLNQGQGGGIRESE